MRPDEFGMCNSTVHTRTDISRRAPLESPTGTLPLKVVAWIRDGLPNPSRGSRRLPKLLDLDLAVSIIRSAPLTPDDAGRIVQALKDRDLIRDAAVGAGPMSKPLITFLVRFWDSEQSPYVRERVAHGQRISRSHCREASNRLEYCGPLPHPRAVPPMPSRTSRASMFAPAFRSVVITSGFLLR